MPEAFLRWRVAPDGAAALAAWGLAAGDGAADARRLAAASPLGRNDGREVRVLDDPERRRPTLYLKSFARRRAARAAQEERCLVALRDHGLPVPPLLGSAEGGDGTRQIVLGELRGEPLDRWLRAAPATSRRAASVALGRALARMHAAGAAHRQLFAWHVVIDADGTIGWLDVGEARLHARPASDRERARDLAALFATVSRPSWPLADRARLLRAYEPERERRRALVAAIRRARLRLLRRARVPRDFDCREWRREGERVLVATRHAAAAERAGATDAAAWLAPVGAVVVRTRDGRTNLRWSAPLGALATTWFGKRFDEAPWRGRAPAFQEMLAMRAVAALGIEVAPSVAVARLDGGASVLWTEGIEPGTTVREKLPRLDPSRERAARRSLLESVASIARRLHAAGFVHRDLYLDHFLLGRAPGTAPERARGGDGNDEAPLPLVLIDFTRLRAFAGVPARALAKDLAALEFSARAAGATRAERWRALLSYARGDRRRARTLARAALRRADRTARHERRHGRPAPSA